MAPKVRRSEIKALLAVVVLSAGLAGPATAGSDPGKLGQDLIKAAGKGDVAQVRGLLDKGVPVDTQDKDGKTALWEASRHDKADVVALLLSHKANPELADKGGDTPLVQAIEHGNPRVVDALLAAGADTHWRGKTGGTLLMVAAAGGNGEVVERVLKLGGDVEAEDAEGETALFRAARQGSGNAIDVLVRAHARVDHPSRRRLSPLMAAAQAGRSEAVRALLSAGAQADLRNDMDKGWTALMYAAAGQSSSVIDELAGAGALVNVEDSTQDMPIHIAARRSNGSVTHALIEHGAHVNRRSGYDHKTPLEIAVDAGGRDVAAQLVDGGACVTSAMRDHATAKKDEKMLVILAAGEGRGCHKP